MDILLSLFLVTIQNYIEMRTPTNSAKLHELSLKYEGMHDSYRGGGLDKPRQIVISFHVREIEMILEEGNQENGNGYMVMAIETRLENIEMVLWYR